MNVRIQFLAIILIVTVSPLSSSQRSGSSGDTVVVNQKLIHNYLPQLSNANFLLIKTRANIIVQGRFVKAQDSLLIIENQNVYQAQSFSNIKEITTFTKPHSQNVVAGILVGGGFGFFLADVTKREEPPPPPDYHADDPNLTESEQQRRESQQQSAQSQYEQEVRDVRNSNANKLALYPLIGAAIGATIANEISKKVKPSSTVYIFADNMTAVECQQVGLIEYQGQWLTKQQQADYQDRQLIYYDGYWVSPYLKARVEQNLANDRRFKEFPESTSQNNYFYEPLIRYGDELILTSELQARGGAVDDFNNAITHAEIVQQMKTAPPLLSPEACPAIAGATLALYQLWHSHRNISSRTALSIYGAAAVSSYALIRLVNQKFQREAAIHRIKQERKRFYEHQFQQSRKHLPLKMSPSFGVCFLNNETNRIVPMLTIKVSH
jgi:hypothetical protein